MELREKALEARQRTLGSEDVYYYTKDKVNTSTPSGTEPIHESSASISASAQPPVDRNLVRAIDNLEGNNFKWIC
jgi:hypothetical protein